MKAVILAAGKGERMKPLTDRLPKPLLRVEGRTFLDHILDSLPAAVSEVIVVVGYKGDQIRKYLGSFYKGKNIVYVHQRKLEGTGKAFLLAEPMLRGVGRFLVFYGDELTDAREVARMMAYRYSVLCHKITRPIPTGVVKIGARGRILRLSEKRGRIRPPVISTGGAMLLDEDIFRYKPVRHSNGEFYLSSMLGKFLKTHPVYAVMGRPDSYFISKDDIDKANTM